MHSLPKRLSPTSHPSKSESPSNSKPDALRHFPQPINTSRNHPQLPRVPYPNLTLTLALIYVDRLKAKNPEAKGESGCSHRLFLTAFIIAAKYRCSVELAPYLSEDASSSENSLYYDPPEEEHSLDSRLNSELIFSNHAWVRLLNLGSFARTPATPTSAGSASGSSMAHHPGQSSPRLSVPPSPQVSETSTMASSTPMPTTPTHGQASTHAQLSQQQQQQQQQQSQGLSSIMGSILQVEDLDRMEAEFLTFLNFDLATMSHDLETCWNLLVGKKE
ncbi:hypothetical protein BGX29_004711 [Mortierella sp. GBA35]|nr:hypothetical protein BGX29_004711 [Mortierella sp. GBA35]